MCRDVFRMRPLSLDELLAMNDFLRAHGLDPSDVPRESTIVFDHTSKCYVLERLVRDPVTHRFVIDQEDNGVRTPRIELVTVPAVTDFPL